LAYLAQAGRGKTALYFFIPNPAFLRPERFGALRATIWTVFTTFLTGSVHWGPAPASPKKKHRLMFEKIKLWVLLHAGDIKATVALSVPIVFLAVLVNMAPRLLREVHYSGFDSQTAGILDTLIQIKGIRESQEGGSVATLTYRVNYHYEIAGKTYGGSEYVHRRAATIAQRVLLNKMERGDTLLLKYKNKKPSSSVLLLR
jgi:hypothetical protein